jgi:hypothetical protein
MLIVVLPKGTYAAARPQKPAVGPAFDPRFCAQNNSELARLSLGCAAVSSAT